MLISSIKNVSADTLQKLFNEIMSAPTTENLWVFVNIHHTYSNNNQSS